MLYRNSINIFSILFLLVKLNIRLRETKVTALKSMYVNENLDTYFFDIMEMEGIHTNSHIISY